MFKMRQSNRIQILFIWENYSRQMGIYIVKLFASHCRVDLYCSDVSGAFDNACRNILIRKLNVYFHGNILQILALYLAVRKTNICVNDKISNEMEMTNIFFQGTVLNPILRNLFLADAQNMETDMSFESIVYADDLHANKTYANLIE